MDEPKPTSLGQKDEPLSIEHYQTMIREASKRALLIVPQTVLKALERRPPGQGLPDDRQILLFIDLSNPLVTIPPACYRMMQQAWQEEKVANPDAKLATKMMLRVQNGRYRKVATDADRFYIEVHLTTSDEWEIIWCPWGALLEYWDMGVDWTIVLQPSPEREKEIEEIERKRASERLTGEDALRTLQEFEPKKKTHLN